MISRRIAAEKRGTTSSVSTPLRQEHASQGACRPTTVRRLLDLTAAGACPRSLHSALVQGVALCSVTIVRVLLKVLGKTFVMMLLCHSRECGRFLVPSLFCLLGLLLYFSSLVVTLKRQGLALARFASVASTTQAPLCSEIKGDSV